MNATLENNIAVLRKQRGLSQEDLAEKAGVSRQAVSNWERGVAMPDVEMLNRLTTLFDVDLSSLVNGETRKLEKRKDAGLLHAMLLAASVVLMIVHFVLAFMARIEFFPVVLIPGVLVSLSVLIHFIFRHTAAQNDFSIIAGFDGKKDNVGIVKKQLATIDLLNLAVVFFFNVLFFMMYARSENGLLQGCLILLGTYFLTFIIIVVFVNLKMKSR